MLRFLKNLLKHPGTWVLNALAMVGIAMLVPIAAPGLLLVAAVSIVLAAIAFIPYALNFIIVATDSKGFPPYSGWEDKKTLAENEFFKSHPVQAIVVGLTAAAFIAALVLTIGFFTGGAGFVFMAPLFSAMSAPFAIAAASAHLSLFMPALVGFCFVVAPLTIGNNLKRFLGWLDSFKYDFAVEVKEKNPNTEYHKDQGSRTEIPNRVILEELAFNAIREHYQDMPEIFHYPAVLALGAVADVVNYGCSSAHECKSERNLALEAKTRERANLKLGE
jgi:hypothetical protein